MENSRKFSRFNVGFDCLLRDNANKTYKAFLYDLSYGGAGILVDDFTPFKCGEVCELLLSRMQSGSPIIHNCKVAWVNSRKMGLEFLI